MKTLKFIYLVMPILGVLLIITPTGWAQPKSATKLPIITNAYAADKGQYGTIWRIYVEAEAADAEMVEIAAVVNQPGQGQYLADFTLLKAPYRKHVKGYLQWNTFSSKGPSIKEGEYILLRVSVIDKAGHESNEVVFPFTFASGTKAQGPLPAPFDQGDIPRIGHIGIDLKGSVGGKGR